VGEDLKGIGKALPEQFVVLAQDSFRRNEEAAENSCQETRKFLGEMRRKRT
jgi:hypothetical protein